jgi:fibronectin type 3 domain-containing protein
MLIASLCAAPDAAQAATVNVSWASNTEADLASYRLQLGTVSGQYDRSIPVGTSTSAQVDGLQVDTTYYMAVVAIDQAGNESLPSSEVSARITSTPEQLATTVRTVLDEPRAV